VTLINKHYDESLFFYLLSARPPPISCSLPPPLPLSALSLPFLLPALSPLSSFFLFSSSLLAPSFLPLFSKEEKRGKRREEEGRGKLRKRREEERGERERREEERGGGERGRDEN